MYLKPLITEKAVKEAAGARYTFLVAPKMNKKVIAKVIEGTFGVTVRAVETVKVLGKFRRYGKRAKAVKGLAGKKAIVSLVKGQKIDLFEAPAQEDSPVKV